MHFKTKFCNGLLLQPGKKRVEKIYWLTRLYAIRENGYENKFHLNVIKN